MISNQSRLGAKFPKQKPKFWGVNRHFKQILQKFNSLYLQYYSSDSRKIWQADVATTEALRLILYNDIIIPRWRTTTILNFKKSVVDRDIVMKFSVVIEIT